MKNYFRDLKIEDQIMLLRAFKENEGVTEKIIEINNKLDSNGCRKDFLFGFIRMINLEQNKKEEICDHIIEQYSLTEAAKEELRNIVKDRKNSSDLLFKIESFLREDIEVDSCFIECVGAAYRLKNYEEQTDLIEEANKITISARENYRDIIENFSSISDFYNEVCEKVEKLVEGKFFDEVRDEA